MILSFVRYLKDNIWGDYGYHLNYVCCLGIFWLLLSHIDHVDLILRGLFSIIKSRYVWNSELGKGLSTAEYMFVIVSWHCHFISSTQPFSLYLHLVLEYLHRRNKIKLPTEQIYDCIDTVNIIYWRNTSRSLGYLPQWKTCMFYAHFWLDWHSFQTWLLMC